MKMATNGTMFCLATLAIVLMVPSPIPATPPTPPVHIDATLEEIKGTAEQGRLSYDILLILREKAEQVHVEAFLTPHDSEQFTMKKRSIFREQLKLREEQHRMEIPLTVRGPGTYELIIRVWGKMDGDNGFSDKILRYLIVDRQKQYRILSPKQFVGAKKKARERRFEEALRKNPDSPDIRLLHENTSPLPDDSVKSIEPHKVETPLRVRPTGPSDDIKKYIEEKSDSAWAPEDPLTIRGNLSYLDFDNVWRPLVNVSVNLYDEDVGFDDHLGTTSTDWSGNWSFSVNNDDGWLADGRDIYYTFKLENTRIRVQNCAGIDSTYRWQSEVHDDLDDGTLLDFGNRTGGTNINSMQIWNMLNLAWTGTVTLGGRDPGFVDACFPEGSGASWDRFWEEIDIPGSDNDAPDVVTHEYGHAVMYYAYGSDNPSPGGSHSFGDDLQNASLAWSEGWATGFMLALRPDGRYNWSEGDTGRNIENFSDAGNRNGNRNEGRVAAAINDMIDSPDDDNGGNLDRGRDDADDDNQPNRVALSTMLNDTLWGSWHDDFEEFWASLSGELSGAILGDANEIMYYNYMNVPAPISCVATKVVAMESPRPDQMLEGLRRFRDHVLKGFNGGQRLINLYYRNSPEIARILLQDPKLRREAAQTIRHFSELGFAVTENKRFKEIAGTQKALIDDKTARHTKKLLKRIREKASEDLRKDMEPLTEILESVRGMSVKALQKKVEDMKTMHPKTHRTRIIPSEFSATSRKAAESSEVMETLKQYMPPFDEK